MKSRYMSAKAQRREARNIAGRFRGGKLAPVMAVPFLGSESGSVQQSISYELDRVAGRLLTDVTAEVISVFVPALAMDAMNRDQEDHAGNEEIFRQMLMTGEAVFATEPETEISKRCGVVPSPVAGVKRVSSTVRLAHNCAVNFLRRRKYVNAVQVDKNNTALTPALISDTVLDRLNGVLDPEDRVNGAVNFSGQVPVHGIALQGVTYASEVVDGRETGGAYGGVDGWTIVQDANALGDGRAQLRIKEDQSRPGYPSVTADLAGAGNSISLSDMYRAERMDALTREMRTFVDQYPEFGEELVARFAHGLDVDPGKQPFVVYEKRTPFSKMIKGAMDGPNLDVNQTVMTGVHNFVVPIPATEFGGVLITFAAVKPDETLGSQPHPILSRSWAAKNFVADELAVDPVPVTIRELDADCAQGDEETTALYVGNNHMEKTYINYGFNRHLDPTTVENKTAIWQLEVPYSVTPQTVLYPESLPHYPFQDQQAEVCTYSCSSIATVNTPTIFGPTPVEELAAIEELDVFDEDV